MNGGGGPNNDPPPPQPPPPHHNDGDFLLRLLQNHQQQQQQQQQQQFQQQQQQQQQQLAYLHHNISATPSHTLPLDPAVAALGPTMPIPTNHHQPQHHDPHRFSPQSQNPNFPLQGFHRSSPNSNHTPSLLTAPHQHFDLFRQQQQQQHQQQQQQQQQHPQFRHEQQGLFGNSSFLSSSSSNPVEDETLRLNKLGLEFGLLKERELVSGLGSRNVNGFDPNRRIDPRVNWGHGSPDQRWSGPPPGFSSKPGNQRRDFYQLSNVGGERSDLYTELKRNPGNQRRDFDHSSNVGGERSELYSELKRNPGNQRRDFDQLGNVGGERSDLHSELKRGNHGLFGSNSKSNEKDRKFMSNGSGNALIGQLDHPGLPTGSSLHSVSASDVEQSFLKLDGAVANNGGHLDEVDDLSEQLVDSVLREDQPDEQNDTSTKKKHYRDKDFRSDARGKWILSQRMRNNRRMIECRRDIDRLDAPFLAIYDSLIPAKEEKEKQKQLMKLLEKLVQKEWPDAKLSLYGSCANSFGVSKSDIDVCLAVDDQDANKSEMLLRLADILQSDYQDVQALTRARVPIVKLRDPVTGISCDICVNNVLAVVNTKLLRDYAAIDPRLRQLAFLVKHWAKSRGVNETYQGTLSSYAYVLMCIHFLQKLNPPILPCLQNMEPTYVETVDDIKCNFFDRVEILRDFGAQNEEKISKLLWGFFNYWAYCHDYANHVISVRTGSILRKEEKDWTRRIGNDRHLICIEDPFETSHDLGRVVDKRSIRVLREEFERAAEIMQYDPNPCVALFEPYIPC